MTDFRIVEILLIKMHLVGSLILTNNKTKSPGIIVNGLFMYVQFADVRLCLVFQEEQ